MGRGERNHLLFLGAGYSNRDLILASSRRWLRTRREMKGRHTWEGQQSCMGWDIENGVRNYLFVPAGILLVLTIMSSSGANPPLKLLALGKCLFFFSFPQMTLAN